MPYINSNETDNHRSHRKTREQQNTSSTAAMAFIQTVTIRQQTSGVECRNLLWHLTNEAPFIGIPLSETKHSFRIMITTTGNTEPPEELAAAKRAAAKRWRKRHPAAFALIQHRRLPPTQKKTQAAAKAKWQELLTTYHNGNPTENS